MDIPIRLLKSVQTERQKCEADSPRLLARLCVMPELYQAEEASRSVDPALLAGEESSRCFGTCHTTLPLNHRQSIIQWMCNASIAIGWSYASLYTAISIFDSYALRFYEPRAVVQESYCADSDQVKLDGINVQLKAPSLRTCIKVGDLPSLSASCLYLGACLRESVIDQTIISVEEFQRICPEIGSAYVIRSQQIELLGLLKSTGSPGNRTPYDLAQLFIERLAFFPQTSPIYEQLLYTDSIKHLVESIMQVSTVCYLNTISLCLPASSWVACTLTHLCQQLLPVVGYAEQSRFGAEMLCCIANEVMEYPGGFKAIRQLLKLYRPVVRAVFAALNSAPVSRWKSKIPAKQHVFRMPSSLTQNSICSFKSQVIIQFRIKILPTLKLIGRELTAATMLSMGAQVSYRRSITMIDQENSPVGAGRLLTRPPKLQHIRRHTSVCNCAQCTHYQENPPDWKRLIKYYDR